MFGYTLFSFNPDKILLGVGLHLFVFGKCEGVYLFDFTLIGAPMR
jgi:hypothetical protein